MLIFQKGFNFSQDGPGNRLVYHLQGCNFRCPWCSNPEGMPLRSDIAFELSPKQLLSEAVACSPMFFDGGGVTFTGGECTLQHGELLEALKLLKSEGINTAIETNLSDPRLFELLPFADYLMADLKLVDSKLHFAHIGAPNSVTLENFKSVFKSGRQVLVRIPLIGGVNTDVKQFVSFFGGFDRSKIQVEVLPYHEYGKAKWITPYSVKNGFVSDETVESFKRALTDIGLDVIST